MPQESNTNSTKQSAEVSSPWISRKDAALYACVSIDTIDYWIKNGWIKRIKTNQARCGRVIIEKKSIDAFFRHCNSGTNG